jgi:hypothetical protein
MTDLTGFAKTLQIDVELNLIPSIISFIKKVNQTTKSCPIKLKTHSKVSNQTHLKIYM